MAGLGSGVGVGPGANALPVLRGPLGGLAHGGPVAFKHTVLTAHPVEAIQRAHFKNESDAALHIAERVYGAHSAWQMKLDRALLSRMQPRAPGAEPRGFGPLETYLRRDDKLDMEDVLGLPELKPRVERLSVHQAAERALSLDR